MTSVNLLGLEGGSGVGAKGVCGGEGGEVVGSVSVSVFELPSGFWIRKVKE